MPPNTDRLALLGLARLIESREDATGRHVDRIAEFSLLLAREFNRTATPDDRQIIGEANEFAEAAMLHDIGKVCIPDAILLKPGKLTAAEFEAVKSHTVHGSIVVASDSLSLFHRLAREITRSHHEKWDGAGYPDGLKGAAIPLAARIVAVADAYDALASGRCYKPATTHERSIEIIARAAGAHFDPSLVECLLSIATEFNAVRQKLAS